MSERPDSELRLDGNSAAGLLQEVFPFEMTNVSVTCAGCGAVGRLGALPVAPVARVFLEYAMIFLLTSVRGRRAKSRASFLTYLAQGSRWFPRYLIPTAIESGPTRCST